MANTTLNIAELNPVKFYSETLAYPDNYRSRFIDDFNFQNQIRSFEEKVWYSQKWMHDDVIHLQLETDFTDIKIQVVDGDERIYKSIIPDPVSSSIDPSPLSFLNASITLDDLQPGEYFVRIQATVEGAVKNYDSEPFEVSEVVENSILLHYSNNSNDYNVAFDTDIVFQLRVGGGLTQFKPANKRKVYEDQNLNNVKLSAIPFRTGKLIIGGPEGVPDWVIDKVNRIFCCDYVTIDGKQFVRPEGDMEPTREEYYPMTGWSFDVLEAQNKSTKEFNISLLYGILDYDGALLVDYDNNALQIK